MEAKVVFTSSLSQQILTDLNECAEKFKKNKNQILEAALKMYFNELKRIEYSYSFKRAAKDSEAINMANEGFTDYIKMLEKHEK